MSKQKGLTPLQLNLPKTLRSNRSISTKAPLQCVGPKNTKPSGLSNKQPKRNVGFTGITRLKPAAIPNPYTNQKIVDSSTSKPIPFQLPQNQNLRSASLQTSNPEIVRPRTLTLSLQRITGIPVNHSSGNLLSTVASTITSNPAPSVSVDNNRCTMAPTDLPLFITTRQKLRFKEQVKSDCISVQIVEKAPRKALEIEDELFKQSPLLHTRPTAVCLNQTSSIRLPVVLQKNGDANSGSHLSNLDLSSIERNDDTQDISFRLLHELDDSIPVVQRAHSAQKNPLSRVYSEDAIFGFFADLFDVLSKSSFQKKLREMYKLTLTQANSFSQIIFVKTNLTFLSLLLIFGILQGDLGLMNVNQMGSQLSTYCISKPTYSRTLYTLICKSKGSGSSSINSGQRLHHTDFITFLSKLDRKVQPVMSQFSQLLFQKARKQTVGYWQLLYTMENAKSMQTLVDALSLYRS